VFNIPRTGLGANKQARGLYLRYYLYMKQTVSAGGFIVNEAGQVLMVQEYGHFWGLPRGHVEKDESLLQTAKREIREEAGIETKQLQYHGFVGSYGRFTFALDGSSTTDEYKQIHIFFFTATRPVIGSSDPSITAVAWQSFTQGRKLLLNKEDIEFFDKCVEFYADEKQKRNVG